MDRPGTTDEFEDALWCLVQDAQDRQVGAAAAGGPVGRARARKWKAIVARLREAWHFAEQLVEDERQ